MEKYYSVDYDFDLDIVVATTFDKSLLCFGQKGLEVIFEIDASPHGLTKLMLVKELKVLLVGTTTGAIRMYLWPFDLTLKVQEFSDTPVH